MNTSIMKVEIKKFWGINGYIAQSEKTTIYRFFIEANKFLQRCEANNITRRSLEDIINRTNNARLSGEGAAFIINFKKFLEGLRPSVVGSAPKKKTYVPVTELSITDMGKELSSYLKPLWKWNGYVRNKVVGKSVLFRFFKAAGGLASKARKGASADELRASAAEFNKLARLVKGPSGRGLDAEVRRVMFLGKRLSKKATLLLS